jgi:pyruvate dehydrogenase E2 component (dihydrolipoamide acetyltransferase)
LDGGSRETWPAINKPSRATKFSTMEIEVKLPELGDGIKSGDILEVLVRVGDSVQRDQGLLEVETDKATVTLPSTHAGKVTKLLVQAGQTVPIGSTVVVLEVEAPAAKPVAPPAQPAAAPAAPAAPPASAVAPVAPAPAAPAPAAPTPAASAPVAAAPVAPVPLPPVRPMAPVAPPAPAAVASGSSDDDAHVAAGPAIRRFAREVGVDLRVVEGTGENGRITREDVLEVVRRASQQVSRTAGAAVGALGAVASAVAHSAAQIVSHAQPVAEAGTASAPAATPAATATPGDGRDAWGPVRVERMTKIRKTIATKMHESWTTVPRVTNMDDADITELEKIRQASKEDYAARGIKLTSLPFVIKAVAMALRNNPVLNASIDMESGTIIYKDYINIGIAVDSDRGLVVPSLRAADDLSIAEIARRLAGLADMVRDNAFAIDDLRGSTFTISNLGAVGGSYATPIINTPEVAILLIGRARQLPVVVDNQIVPRLMLPLSLSYDHRLVDGGAAARFLNDVIAYLKAPSRLLLAP